MSKELVLLLAAIGAILGYPFFAAYVICQFVMHHPR